LPGEGALPAKTGEAQEIAGGPLPLEGSPDGIPWLRLNLRGHTAPIRTVQFLAAGNRFCSAGDDKSVIVWSRDPSRADRWQYERTIRWQIQRGTRGRIYSLAATPQVLAIGGEGAMGGTGEIVLVDPVTGRYDSTLFDEAQGHRQVVVALDFCETAAGPVLASQSMDGRTLLWARNESGVWRARVVVPDDRAANIAPQLAGRLLAGRSFSAVVALDSHRVCVPRHDPQQANRIDWQLEVVDIDSGARSPLGAAAGPRHAHAVLAMATDARRSRLVSADGAGAIYLWDLTRNPARVRKLPRTQPGVGLSLSLSQDGRTLALGTPVVAQGKAHLEIWELADFERPRMLATHAASNHVQACALGPDALVSSEGEVLTVRGLPSAAVSSQPQSLRGATERPLRVAFASNEPIYRIGVGTAQGERDGVAVNRVFDTDRLRLTRGDAANEQDWLPQEGSRGDWQVSVLTDSQGQRQWVLTQAGTRRARLPLTESRDGVFRCVYWLPGANPAQPEMAVIGTSAGGILVVKLTGADEAPIVRRFRGHTSDVTSLAVSRDGRWLASSSADATVRVWPLGALAGETGSVNRWGATFAEDDEGRLRIESIREDGPLFFRGARQGDEVVSCEWMEAAQRRSSTDPRQILPALEESPWDRVVAFELQTGRQATRRFQILPAWQQMVSLVMDSQGEWAYWAPAGYYDASFEGHRLFGWQINRGLGELPSFFLAAQFRGVLERPDVMSQLLRAGTVEAAFRAVRADSPADAAQTIANTYRLQPEVTILAPDADVDLAAGPEARTLRARIRVPAGQQLVTPKAFANGVVAPAGRLVQRDTQGGNEVLEYEWQLAVPSDPRVLVQVVASTADEVSGSDQRLMANTAPATTRKPRLFFLAVAIDAYRDAQIPRLRTPVAHATALTDLLRDRAAGLYRVEATSLLDQRATRPAWTFLTEHSAERLRAEAQPDDLVVFYLSGHGLQDPVGDQFHFVTADARYADTMSGSYADCLSFGDFAQFADISCRKLVILDTCHGGAIQPLRHREMKSAVRSLQQDLLVTLAASDGSQEAVEGRFSQRLLEALSGAADREGGDRDGVVRLDEVIAYVDRKVTEDSARDPEVQTPSAGPLDLLPYTAVPLSTSSPSQAIGGRAIPRR
jgi:WD40 repeat protein